jgi:hypothetical protein
MELKSVNRVYVNQINIFLIIHKIEGVEMRKINFLMLIFVLSLALISFNCKDDDEDPVIPEKYIGTWVADSSLQGTLLQLAPIGQPDEAIDFLDFGYDLRATINKDATYSLNTTVPFFPVGGDQGRITLDEEAQVISFISNDPESDPIIFFYEWEGDILVLGVQAPLDLGQGEEIYEISIKLKKSS